MNYRLYALMTVIALTACGGGGGGMHATPAAPATPAQTPALASIRLTVPAQAASASTKRRHAQFVAWTTAGMTVSAYTSPRTSHLTAIAQTSFDVSAASANCTTSATGRLCTLAFPLPAQGTDDFVVTSYDTAPASGTIPPTANQLGIGIDAGVTIAGGSNALSFTLNGVVASATVQLPVPGITALAATTQVVNVQALDANQNTIVTDAYSDAQGNPVTIALAVTGASSAHFLLAPASITVPMPNGVTLAYFGNVSLNSTEFDNGFSVAVTATPSNAAPVASATIAAQAPLTVFTSLDTLALLNGIATGADGALWFTEAFTPNAIGRLTLPGVYTEFTIPTGGSEPVGITAGPDGNLWFTEELGENIGQITTSGTITEFPASGTPAGITTGPDGNLWFTECSASDISSFNPTTLAITTFSTLTAGATPQGITAGPDGKLWFTESTSDTIGNITTAGVVTEFLIPTANTHPHYIAVGSDGALWFTQLGLDAVGRITTAGVITEILTPGTSWTSIATGGDGNIWVGTNGEIGRIVPGATPVVTMFANPHSGHIVAGMVKGPNGDVYFADDLPAIGRIAL
jgi:streptogramin lyase